LPQNRNLAIGIKQVGAADKLQHWLKNWIAVV
jgi:hypothetical protein